MKKIPQITILILVIISMVLIESCKKTTPPKKFEISKGVTMGTDGRIEKVLAKMKKGEPINYVALGGSITVGHLASPLSSGWAGLVAQWFNQKSNGTAKYINSGVSGTDSAIGAYRIEQDVISKNPDVVIFEFAINDQWLDPELRKESFEGVVRQILNAPSQPAVILLFLCEKNKPSTSGQQAEQKPIGEKYSLPMISFGESFQAEIDAGNPATDPYAVSDMKVSWERFGNDTIHPNLSGHSYIGKYITDYLEVVLAGLSADGTLPAVKPVPAGNDLYTKTVFFGNADIKPVMNTGWTEGSQNNGDWEKLGSSKDGWTTTQNGAQMIFDVTVEEGSTIALYHSESDQYRNAKAWVDDGKKVNLIGFVGSRNGYLGWKYVAVGKNLSAGTHKLYIQASDSADDAGKAVEVVNIMVAGTKVQ